LRRKNKEDLSLGKLFSKAKLHNAEHSITLQITGI